MKTRSALLLAATMTAALIGLVPKGALALTVSPPTYDYTLNPGDTVKDYIKLSNESGEAVTIYPEVFNFTFKEGDEVAGTPEFYPSDVERNGRELAKWIRVDTAPITLQPAERYNLEFSVVVPKDGSPGGHFGSIQFRNSPTEGGGQITLIGGTGVLILARINGRINDEMTVDSFGGEKDFYTSLPVLLHTRLVNSGNSYLQPVGNVFVTDMFGNQAASIEVNPDIRRVLPGSARRFDVSWYKRRLRDDASEYAKEWGNFALGKYTATLALNYGSPDNQKFVTSTFTFWVVPWMVLLTVFGVIVALALVFGFGVRGYNRMIIRRYEEGLKHPKK